MILNNKTYTDEEIILILEEMVSMPSSDFMKAVLDLIKGQKAENENLKNNSVEIVRCKDCDVPHNKWTGCPYMNGLIP